MTLRPLKVLFDARMASWGGVGRYTTGLIGGLAEIADETGISLSALRLTSDAHLFSSKTTGRLLWLDCEHGPWSLAGLQEARQAATEHADVFHAPHITLFPPGFSGTRVGTLHDVIPLQYPDTIPSPRRRAMHLALLRAFIAQARWLLLGSRRAATDAMAVGLRLPRFTVIPHAVDQRFHPRSVEDQQNACREVHIRPGSIMWIGPFRRHKNLETLLQAYAFLPAALRAEIELVLLGANKSPYAHELATLAARLVETGQPGGVRFPGYVQDHLLPALLSSAALYVLPSLTEGFGLPALEAWCCGTRVAASDTTPVREFLGSDAWYFDPRDPEGLAELMDTLLQPPRQPQIGLGPQPALDLATRTWAQVAHATAQCYRWAHDLRGPHA